MKNMLLALWHYRHFIFGSIKNEFATRFARSRLGGAWMILHPLAQVAIYALVLSAVLAAKLPGIDNQYAYAIYLMAGMLAWWLSVIACRPNWTSCNRRPRRRKQQNRCWTLAAPRLTPIARPPTR